MPRETERRSTLRSAIGVSVALLAGCFHGDYSIDLPGGYEIYVLMGETGLCAPSSGRVLVKDGIVEYGVAGHCIVGRLGEPTPEGESRPETGYFLVDTREYEGAPPPPGESTEQPSRNPWGRSSSPGVYFGLTLDELSAMLARRGVDLPALRPVWDIDGNPVGFGRG